MVAIYPYRKTGSAPADVLRIAMTTKLSHHQQYLIEEFAEAYVDKRMERRELLRRVVLLTGSVPLTATMLFALGCGDSDDDAPAAAATATTVPAPFATTEAGVGPGVPATDPSIIGADIKLKGQAGDVLAYMARPAREGTYPAVLIIHENQGLLEHFKDVARRFAKEGFVGLSIDLLSRKGGTTTDMAAVMQAYRELTTADFVADMKSSLDYLKAQPFVKPAALGVTGFCFGGTQTWSILMNAPELKAAIPFYGSLDPALQPDLAKTKAAVMVVYGGNDARITAQAPMIEEQLKAAGQPYEIKIYEGAGHAFFNEGRGAPYNATASADAWKSMLGWFRKYLTA